MDDTAVPHRTNDLQNSRAKPSLIRLAEQLSQLLAHLFRPLGRLCANRKSIARSEHLSVLQNPHVPHAAVHVHPTGVGVVINDQCPEAFGLRRRRIGATSATARNATSIRRLALTPIRFSAQLRDGRRMLLYVFQKRSAPGMADQEQSRRQGRTAHNTQDFAVPLSTTACKSCPPITKSARFGRLAGSALVRLVG